MSVARAATGRAYYNEYEPYAAQWLRNLIAAGHIPAGDVDERSIVDVRPDDLAGYRQCHFFAGLGGWARAARVACWPDDRELWTGSAPCQPFSVAGQGKAQADDRHLWPHLFRLLSARRPAVFMGEQVAAAVGKNWLDGVLADLESIGYAGRAVVVPACAVDAPHRRDRLWFVADARSTGLSQRERIAVVLRSLGRESEGQDAANADRTHDALADADSCSVRVQSGRIDGPGGTGAAGLDRNDRESNVADRNSDGRESRNDAAPARHREAASANSGSNAWAGAEWIVGHDGKARRVEPRIRLLAHGVQGRVAVVRTDEENGSEVTHWYHRASALKALGNAIVPQVAAEVIGAYLECAP